MTKNLEVMESKFEEIQKKNNQEKTKFDNKIKKKKKKIEDNENIINKKQKLKNNKTEIKDNAIQNLERGENDQSVQKTVDVNAEDEELEEEVKKKQPSKRQLKKEKAELRAAEAREAIRQETAQKTLNYVSKWKHARHEWKFEKIKQIWLIDNLLNDKYVPNDHFSNILEYFEGCKGSARKQLVDKAMAIVKKIEDNIEENIEVTETTEYKRARQLLQALPVET